MIACIDLDNTLAYTSKMHLSAFRMAFSYYGLKNISDRKILGLFGLVTEKMIGILYPEVKKDLIHKISMMHNKIAVKKTYVMSRQIKGANSALKYLKSQGFKVVIISNSSLPEVKKVIKHTKLKNFDRIITKGQVKHGKPSPDGINLAKRIFNSKDGIMVGDTEYDIIAGKKARITTIAVLTGDEPIKNLKKYKPDYILKSIADIKNVV